MAIQCPKCQGSTPSGATCQWCGAAFSGGPPPPPKNEPCPGCSRRNEPETPFCQFCGHVLIEGAERPEIAEEEAEAPRHGEREGPIGHPVRSNMAISIFSTACCCLPLGIVAIVHAARANAHNSTGNYVTAAAEAKKAQTWTIVAIVLGLIVQLIYLATMR